MALPLIFLPIFLLLPTFTSGIRPTPPPLFSEAPEYRNNELCATPSHTSSCDPSLIHIAMTLDLAYIRGTIAAVHSILQHSSCPDNIFFHFLAVPNHLHLRRLIHSTFPSLRFQVYFFNPSLVSPFISSSVREALEKPLNYARNHIADILPECVQKVIYLDSDIAVVDDIAKLWKKVTLNSSAVISAPVYCHANFTSYFTDSFWRDPTMSRTFDNRRKKPCYFNTGVMVMELGKWREGKYGEKIQRWMEVQRKGDPRIYELGSLPPFLLVFGGNVEGLDHRWNQHGLGGDNVVGSCRRLHPGGVSLLHWSGKGKPWVRLDEGRPCPIDLVWKNYDLYFGRSGSSFF